MSDDSVITFGDAKDEENIEQHGRGHEDESQLAGEVEGIKVDESLEDIAEDFETILSVGPKDFTDDPAEGVQERTSPAQRVDIVSRLSTDLEVSLEDIQEDIEGGSIGELLLDIAQSNRIIATVISNLAQTNINQLQAQHDILSAVEPLTSITVSGTNSIDNEGEVIEVVPNSDTESIPTRVLMMKANDQNQGEIAIGDDEIDPGDGWILDNGEHVIIDFDLRENALWMSGENVGDEMELLGMV